MTENKTITPCTVPEWFGIPARNDTTAYINEIIVAVVNIPFCAFAFFINLAIIVTIIKTPSLQRPCNTLLCSLAVTDCLTGVTAQPIFVALRLMLCHVISECSHQNHLFTAFYACTMLTSGWSFAFLTLMSFDRHYALSRPLLYRARVNNKEALTAIALTGVCWLLLTGFAQFVFSDIAGLIFAIITSIIFIIVPTVNHIRMFFAIRRHNNLITDAAVPQQLSVVLRREKKVAVDMGGISLVLLLSLAPMPLNKLIKNSFPKLYITFQPWALTLIFLISSLNPLIYTVRNKALRDGIKSVIFA